MIGNNQQVHLAKMLNVYASNKAKITGKMSIPNKEVNQVFKQRK